MPGVPEASLKRALMLNGLAPPDHHLDIVREGWAATDAAIETVRRVAEACSRGELLADVLPEYEPCFEKLFTQIESRLAA